jgi:putative transposase
VARKFDGSRQRKPTGRPPVDAALQALVVRLTQENRSWGYDRVVGALQHLGYIISDQTVGNILKCHGMSPTHERQKTTTWNEFIRTHMNVLVATDFFTAEVWTWCGLITYYILFFLWVDTREVHLAGVTLHPDQRWMTQIARNMTMADWSILPPGQYLIHDRDGKYCPAFQQMIDAVGVKQISLPPRSPNLNAYAERWIRSVKDEALSPLILFGERSLRYALNEYIIHYHAERPHQGKGNMVLMPSPSHRGERQGPIRCRERLGGLLKYYSQEAA